MGSTSVNTLFLAMCLLGSYCLGMGEMGNRPKTQLTPDYIFELEQINVLGTPQGHLGPDSILYATMYNDTCVVGAAKFYVVEDFPEDTMLSTVLYRYTKTNRWATFLKSDNTLCEYMKTHSFIFERMYENGNLTDQCPPKKGMYYFVNYLVDKVEFPPHMEETKWRMTFDLFVAGGESFIKFEVLGTGLPTDD